MSNNGWTNTIAGMPTKGAIATRTRTTTFRDIELFTEITEDRNPLHYDRALAEKSIFKGLIVQGGITSGLLNAVVAEDLPGPGSVFLGMELKFVKAVYVDDTITATVKVATVREDKPICTLEVKVENQDGEVCLEGTATTFTAALKFD